MKKFLMLSITMFTAFMLTACSSDDVTTYFENEVSKVEAWNDGFKFEVASSKEKELILTNLESLEITEVEVDSDTEAELLFLQAMILTYNDGSGIVVGFDFTNYVYYTETFDSTGNLSGDKSYYALTQTDSEYFKSFYIKY